MGLIRGASTVRARWTVVVLLGLSVLAGGAVSRGTEAGESEPLVLSDHMMEMNWAMRKLKRQISDPEKVGISLVLVEKIQQHALAAKRMVPSLTEDIPSAQRASFVVDYRKKLLSLFRSLLQLEENLLDRDLEKAVETYAALRKIQRDGHKRFRKKEKT